MRFRLPWSARRVEQEVDEELAFHLAERAAELERSGASAEAAREEASRRFGNVTEARRELADIDRRRDRGARRAEWWEGVVHDLRYALRGLRRQPGFAVAVALTIGVGFGATTAMFGVVDRLLLRPPALVRDPGQVGRIYFTEYFSWYGFATQQSTSYPDFVTLRDQTRSLSAVAAYTSKSASLGRGRDAEPLETVAASGEYFALLGVSPQIGRFFGPADDTPPTGEPVVVLSDGFWRRRFGADPAVLGRTMEIDRQTYTIVGVAPPAFTGVSLTDLDVWVPLSTVGAQIAGDDWSHAAGWRWIHLLARLAPGVSRTQAGAEATTLYRASLEERRERDSTATVTIASIIAARGPDSGDRSPSEARISMWLSGVALLVLLIGCANAANLLLARAIRRRREMAVRLALGVTRGRLVRQLLIESLVLAVLGGATGLAIADTGGAMVRTVLLPSAAWAASPFDGRLVAVSVTLVLFVAIATGLAPAWHALSQRIASDASAGAREGPGGRGRLRNALVLLQATLSLVLLVGAGLFVRSLRNVRGVELGVDASRVLVVDLNAKDGDDAARDKLFRLARDQVVRVPVVEQASVAITAPLWGIAISTDLRVPGVDSIPRSRDGGPYINAVTPEFFATTGVSIVGGRGFTDADGAAAPRVAVVSQTFARLVWRGEDPIGRCMLVGGDTVPCTTVVGIARDARRESLTDDAPVMQYYVPLDQNQITSGLRALFVRTRGDPRAALIAVRREVQSVSPDLPYPALSYLGDVVESLIRPWMLGATLFSVFGGVALALAALGLYSVVAYTVAQRVHEMGVRVALGARGRDLARLVVRETLRVVGLGLALGLAVVLAVGPLVEPLLFRVSARDPAVLVAVAGTLLVVGVLASLGPARRAARVSPAEVLKAE